MIPRNALVGFVSTVVITTAAAAQAGPLNSFAELQAILGDQMVFEEFEGLSLPGGTSQDAPNPLNATTAPTWNLQSGATYGASQTLTLYNSATNVLAARQDSPLNEWTMTFDQPQLATGFDLVNFTANLDYNETVTFFRGGVSLGGLSLTLLRGSRQFVGWQDPSGITSVSVTSDAFAIVDDIAWGVSAAVPEPSPALLCGSALLVLLLGWRVTRTRRVRGREPIEA